MSLPPTTTAIEDTTERLLAEAMENGHDCRDGFEPAEVLDVPGFLRLECRRCHEVTYIGPLASQVNPMNPGRCRGRVVVPDLEREG